MRVHHQEQHLASTRRQAYGRGLRLMTRFFALVLMLASAGLSTACGGRQDDAVGGGDLLGEQMPSMMSDAESRARDYVLDMTLVLTSNMEDPEQAVSRMQAFIRVNQDGMLENADLIEDRFANLEGVERRIYEAQFAQFMHEAYIQWRLAERDFGRAHPDESRRISQILRAVDSGQS